jgi:hypothetical protein
MGRQRMTVASTTSVRWSIIDALGKRFNYRELMEGL